MKRNEHRPNAKLDTVAAKSKDRRPPLEKRTSDQRYPTQGPNISREEMRQIIIEMIG